jgi:Asp/Glu/hydantoin racemase
MPEKGAFAATFLANGATLDRDAVERETIDAGRALLARHKVEAIVLECTNLPPYTQALCAALGVPVFDVLDLLRGFYAGLNKCP